MDPPVPPSLEDSFHKSSHKDWKQLLRCVLDSDLPFPESPRISGVLDYFRTENLRHRDLGDYLSKLFQNLCQVASGAQPDPNNALIPAAFVLCLHLIDVKPEAIIRPESLLHERLPRFHIKEFEPLIAPLLTRLMFFKLNLGPDSVKFHPEGSEKPGVTFLTVLIDLAQTILVDSLPIPVTETSVDCVMNLLVMNPAITEKYIGSFAAVILFNMDSVMTQGFSRLLMGTYHRMRQVPKLISRMLQAVGGNPSKIKVCELDTVFMEDFAECVIQLPLLKISELWKTLLFHVNRDIVLGMN